MNPEYPIYVISKGRAESRKTSKALEKMHVPYEIVVEPQEYDEYAAVIDPAKIRTLPFSNLGRGSIPARNWVWEDAIKRGAERHWILDDNLRCFARFFDNKRIRVSDGTIFRAAEVFTDRYENVALSGMQYWMFACTDLTSVVKKPFIQNTRIYSCILIDNAIPFRWRGRYNEDTDLSLRVLKAGWCTILFNAFLCDKITTMSMKGGNTEDLYKLDGEADGRLLMAQSLVRQHPDVARVSRKWGRFQHQVDYSPFKSNKLKRKPGVEIAKGIDNFGMVLKKREDKSA